MSYHPRLYLESLHLLNFDFNGDPDPAFHSNADPEPSPPTAKKRRLLFLSFFHEFLIPMSHDHDDIRSHTTGGGGGGKKG